MIPPAKPRDARPGRHCAVCGRPGGSGFAVALRAAGYDVPRGAMAYAHASCMARAQRAAAIGDHAAPTRQPTNGH